MGRAGISRSCISYIRILLGTYSLTYSKKSHILDYKKIANFEKNSLIIEVKSPVWAQRLQFERNKICQQLIDVTQGKFDRIDIKVNPFTHKKMIKPSSSPADKSSNLISKSTAMHLEDIAQHAPKGLREKLLKLASHGK